MHRSNYIQEVGLKTTGQTVSKPVAIAILALAAAGLWLASRQLHARSDARHAHGQPAAETPVATR